MIERYTRPEMARVWSEQNKPTSGSRSRSPSARPGPSAASSRQDAMPKIRSARYDIDASRPSTSARCTTTSTPSCARSPTRLGEESRCVHLGLTSYDVEDTALALRLVEATELLEQGIQRADGRDRRAGAGAQGHADDGPQPRRPRRADHLRPQAGRLVGRDAPQLAPPDAAPRSRSPSARSRGPVGTHATVPPDLEDDVCGRLGLLVEPVSHAGRPPRPPRPLRLDAGRDRRLAGEVRHRDPPPPAHGGAARSEEPFSAGPDRLVVDAPQAQPGEVRAHLRPGAPRSAATPSPRWRTSPSGTSATSRTPPSSA